MKRSRPGLIAQSAVVGMDPSLKAFSLVVALSAPLASFAQSNQSMTRAQARTDLVRLELAGYNTNDWAHYPQNIQEAEARIAAGSGRTGYGASTEGSSEVGQRVGSSASH
jgi:hypothetical protein